jgi:hypothetical protein
MRHTTTTIALLLLLLPLLLTAQSRQWQWAERGGGDGSDQNNEQEEGVDIALDNNNDVYVCGQTFPLATFSDTTLDFNYTDLNIFLAKYHCEGGLAWVKGFGSSNRDRVNSIATDKENNVYITGLINKRQSQNAILGDDTLTAFGGFYVSKFDSAGNHVWNKIAYADNTIGNEMAIGPDDHLYILGGAGFKRTIFSKYQVERGQFILKMNSLNGAIQWVQPFGHNPTDSVMNVKDMAVDAKGNMYFAGWNNSDTLFFHNAVIPRKSDHSDIIVSKFDSSGQFQWVRRAGGSQFGNGAEGITIFGDSIIYVAGGVSTHAKDVDFGNVTITEKVGTGSALFLARYRLDGSVAWVRLPDSANGNNSATAVNATFYGEIMMGGVYFSGDLVIEGKTYPGGRSSFFARYNPAGDFEEGFQPAAAGSKKGNFPKAIAAGYHNSMVFTGNFEERVVMNDLGDTINNTGGGDYDIITAKYGSDNCTTPDDTGTGTDFQMRTYRSIKVWPNPVSGNNAALRLSRSFEQDAAARIVSTTGRTVWEGELPRGSQTLRPQKKLPAGVYILELQTQEAKYTSKVVVGGNPSQRRDRR